MADPKPPAKRKPPANRSPLAHNAETERCLLGGLLLNSDLLGDVTQLIGADDFARPQHGILFDLVASIVARDKRADLITVLDEADRRYMTEDIGGVSYVVGLSTACPSVANVPGYAARIREHSIRRKLATIGTEIAETAASSEHPADTLIDQAETAIMALTRTSPAKGWRPLAAVVADHMAEIARRAANPEDVVGVTTGFRDLDKILRGLHPGNIVIVAGRPGSGKTCIALNIATAAALSGVGTGIFSLEMSEGELTGRLLSARGRVHGDHLRTGQVDVAEDWPRLGRAAEDLHGLPIWIDDATDLTIAQLRSKAKRLKAEHKNLGLLVIDYLQLMRGDRTNKNDNQENMVSDISRGLKVLAKELEIPIVVLAQLNRDLEKRQDKRPMPSDLRSSGSLEQDADVIIAIYRDEMYSDNSEHKGTAEVLIRKQRAGATGMVRLAFMGEYSLFSDLASEPR